MAELPGFLKFFLRKRFPFKFVYSNEYWMGVAENHIFPIIKYKLIYERLLAMGAKKENFLMPQPAEDEDLLLIHTAKYLTKLKTGTLSSSEMRTLEIPYSPDLVSFFRLMVGGTILAASTALEEGLVIHIGGGFHHAFPDHGEGFCVLNDVAVAVEKLLMSGKIRKAMIVDCDLHQGNGTAAAFGGRKDVFTFSIHQMDLYPAEKVSGSLDVGLWAGDGDEAYLGELKARFPGLYQEYRPDLVLYLAGADPFLKDQLGGLDITLEGLSKRDSLIIGEARKLKIPLAVVFAGGYASDIEDTVAIHLNTIKAAQKAAL